MRGVLPCFGSRSTFGGIHQVRGLCELRGSKEIRVITVLTKKKHGPPPSAHSYGRFSVGISNFQYALLKHVWKNRASFFAKGFCEAFKPPSDYLFMSHSPMSESKTNLGSFEPTLAIDCDKPLTWWKTLSIFWDTLSSTALSRCWPALIVTGIWSSSICVINYYTHGVLSIQPTLITV